MSHWNNTNQTPSYPHGLVTANFMHNGYTDNPWSSLPTTSPYLEDNKLIYSQENQRKLPFPHDKHYQLPVPKTKLPIPNLRSSGKSIRRPIGAPPPYSTVDEDVPPLPLPSFNHPNYPFPPPTSFNNCSFHYNGIPKENPLWAATRNKLYDLNRSAGDDQLAPIPITRKQSIRIGGFACGKALDTGQTRRNLSTRASRRDKFLATAIKRAPQSSNCTKKAPASVSVTTEEHNGAHAGSVKPPSALKTRKTRATQIRNDFKDNIANKDAYSSTTNLPRTPLKDQTTHREDLLRLLAADPSNLDTCSTKNDSIRNEKFASDYRITTKPKSAPKRNARNIFKLQSQHKGAVAIKSKLGTRRSEIACSIKSKNEDSFHQASRAEAKNTNTQLAESVTSLQKIYFQELRKMQSSSSSHTFAKTCSQHRTSRSCPYVARKRSNLRKSTSFCFGQTLDIPIAPLQSQVVASSHKIDSVRRAIAELLKRDLSKEAVDVVTVANREYYVMPVICSMPRTPMNVNIRNSWRTFQCCPSCCTTGCGPFNQMPEPPNTPSHNSSKSLSRNSSSEKSASVSKSPSNASVENCSFETVKMSTNHPTCPSTFIADFLGYHEATECGTQAQSILSGTPADDENNNILDLKPITLTPPSTSKNVKSVGDVVSLLGSRLPRAVTPVLCYTCRTCCSKPACCSRSCSPCRFPCRISCCPPQCPPRCCSPCGPCCPPPCPPRSCSPCAVCPPCVSSCSPCSPCGPCSPICRPYCPPPVPPRPLCQCVPPPPPVPPPNRQCVTAPCCYQNCSPPCSSPKDTCSSPSCSARCPRSCSPSPPPCPFPRPCYRPPTPERCLPCPPPYRPCQPDDACCPLPPLCCPRPSSPCKRPQCNPCSPPPCCPPPWCCDPCCPPRCPSPKKYCPRPCSPTKCSWDPCCPYPCIPPCPPSPCRSPCYSPPRCPPTYCPPGYCSVCCKYPCCCPTPRCCPRPCPPPCTVYPCPAPPSSLCKPCPPPSCCRPCSPCRRPWSPPCSPCRPQCPPCQPYCSSRPCSPYCAPPRPPPCVPKRRRYCDPCGFACPAPCPPPCPSPLCRRCCGKKRRRKRKCCCCIDDNPNFVFPPYKPYSACKAGCFCPEVSYEPFPGCCPY